MVYKNNDVRLELSRLAKQGDPKMKVGAFIRLYDLGQTTNYLLLHRKYTRGSVPLPAVKPCTA